MGAARRSLVEKWCDPSDGARPILKKYSSVTQLRSFFTFLDQLKIILGRNLPDEQKIRNIVKFIFLPVIFDETK